MKPDDLVNFALFVWFLGSLVFLFLVEAYTVEERIPTISERVQWLGNHVTIVRFSATVATVALLIHFFFQGF